MYVAFGSDFAPRIFAKHFSCTPLSLSLSLSLYVCGLSPGASNFRDSEGETSTAFFFVVLG